MNLMPFFWRHSDWFAVAHFVFCFFFALGSWAPAPVRHVLHHSAQFGRLLLRLLLLSYCLFVCCWRCFFLLFFVLLARCSYSFASLFIFILQEGCLLFFRLIVVQNPVSPTRAKNTKNNMHTKHKRPRSTRGAHKLATIILLFIFLFFFALVLFLFSLFFCLLYWFQFARPGGWGQIERDLIPFST